MIFSYAATDNKALHLQYSKLLETRMEVAKKQLEEAEDRAAIAKLERRLLEHKLRKEGVDTEL